MHHSGNVHVVHAFFFYLLTMKTASRSPLSPFEFSPFFFRHRQIYNRHSSSEWEKEKTKINILDYYGHFGRLVDQYLFTRFFIFFFFNECHFVWKTLQIYFFLHTWVCCSVRAMIILNLNTHASATWVVLFRYSCFRSPVAFWLTNACSIERIKI